MKTLTSLEANAQQLLTESVAWMDQFWDKAAGLLWSPGEVFDPHLLGHIKHYLISGFAHITIATGPQAGKLLQRLYSPIAGHFVG